ncbi:N-acetylneuraminate synthase family protein [Flavobacteriaceae bacterium]|nr:N-acetylneuraminate synthase family protein [Flavobacteriaceae bacterium]
MKIDSFEISSNRTFIIAEIGNNHNGSFEKAKIMIDKAIEIGVDCVKFQMRNIEEVYRSRSLLREGDDLGTEYVLDLLEKFELSIDEHKELSNYCKEKGILYMCTPWDQKSVNILESFDVKAYKVASADLTNMPLIDKLCKTGKPLILSTGMSTVEEIKYTTDFINQRKVSFALLHCNSTYPAPIQDINLSWINSLQEIHPIVGYSGHERGINVSLAAISLGAQILERHFTLDRNMEGPDHAASLEYTEFKSLVEGCKEIKQALGDRKEKRISQGEMINRENLSKSLVASRNLKKGNLIKQEDVKVLSPGQGLSPQMLDKLIGKKLKRNMYFEDYFFQSDINNLVHKSKNYDFKLKWGIPVRYHDFKKYQKIVTPDLFEFHLSYLDMDLNIKDFVNIDENAGFVVHAPELFKESTLMDLASPDKEYRNQSIKETQRVIEITKELNKFFPKQEKPLIVANIGGFSMDKPIDSVLKKDYYNIFLESLSQLSTEGVELIPQTMAPFPWHFGGQRYQNLFVLPEEIAEKCNSMNLRICLDVSHSMLACNHHKINFYEFIEKVAPYTAHIHMGDARGINGEGLQIGEGEINFNKLCKILLEKSPNASFIPEIWQGHKNNGEGFWIALERLNSLL